MQELLVSAASLSCHCVGFSYLNFEAYDSCFFFFFFFLVHCLIVVLAIPF